MRLGNRHYLRLADAERETGESRHLINFLIRDRQIPLVVVGTAKLLDEDGMRVLRESIAEYRAKAMAVLA